MNALGETLEPTVHHLTQAVLLCDASGAVMDANPAAFRWQAALSSPRSEDGAPEPWAALSVPVRQAVESGERVLGWPVRVPDVDGRPLSLLVDVTPGRAPDGSVRALVSVRDVTERDDARRDAEDWRVYAERLSNASLDAVISIDAAGAVTAWNRIAEHLFGYTAGEAVGQPLDSLIIPEAHRPAHRAGLARFVRTGVSSLAGTRVELEGCRKDGSAVPVELTIAANHLGSQVVIDAFVRDLRPRRAAEREMTLARRVLEEIQTLQSSFIQGRSSRDLFSAALRAFLSLSGSAVGFIGEVEPGPDGVPVVTLHAVAGVPAGTDIASTPLRIRDPRTAVGRTVVTAETVIENGGADLACDAVPAGAPISSYLGLPIGTPGRLIGIVGLGNRPGGYDPAVPGTLAALLGVCGPFIDAIRRERDRARVDLALRESETRQRLTRDATGIGHWDWNPQTDEALFDEQWAALVGLQRTEVKPSGAGWIELVDAGDFERIRPTLESHLRGETADYRVEFRMRHKDGRWVWVQSIGRVVNRDGAGRPVRVVGIHLDISARKAAEDAVAAARDAAERANDAKSEFLANMSHELRTPMNGVVGAANLLEGTTLDPEQREYVDILLRSSDSMVALIDSILDISRIEAGQLVLESSTFDLREVVAEGVSTVVARAHEKGIELVVDWECRPIATMVGDPYRLRQVLVNLLSNAVKFSPRGTVALRLRRVEPEHLEVAVIDQGIGVPDDKRESIFESFSQVDSTTTRRFGGTGLGLSIARRLVEAMGGRIGVASVVGQGSTFWFTLRVPAEQGEAAVRATTPLAGRRVLLVNTGPALSAAIDRVLTRAGAQSMMASPAVSPQQALETALRSPGTFHNVVFDLEQYRGDRLALVEELARRDDWHATGVVLLTAIDAQHEARRVLARHPARVLAKPVLRDETLVRAVVEAVGTPPKLRAPDASGAMGQTAPVDRSRSRSRGTVLLVEDNRSNQLVTSKLLGALGYDVDTAFNGLAALGMAAESRYDLIIMDCEMPEMDGFEATRAIRAHRLPQGATPSDVPIVALTAQALESDRQRCLTAGMSDYLAKPVTLERLRAALDRWTAAATRP